MVSTRSSFFIFMCYHLFLLSINKRGKNQNVYIAQLWGKVVHPKYYNLAEAFFAAQLSEQIKNGLISGRLACKSSKTLYLKQI